MSFHRSTYDQAPRNARRSITQGRRFAVLSSRAFSAGDTEESGIFAIVAYQAQARRNGESI